MLPAATYMCADLYDPDHNVKFFGFDEKIDLYVEPDTILMWRCYPQLGSIIYFYKFIIFTLVIIMSKSKKATFVDLKKSFASPEIFQDDSDQL